MGSLALGALGSAVGGPLLGFAGALAGGFVDSRAFAAPRRAAGRLDDLRAATSTYGAHLPRIVGTMRLAGTLIWAAPLRETAHEDTAPAKGGGPSVTRYSYSGSFAVALAQGPIASVSRVWANGKLIWAHGRPTHYPLTGLRAGLGGADQLPDPLIEADQGWAPAYRGIATLVIEDLALADFGNALPAITAEIERPLGAPLALLAAATTGHNPFAALYRADGVALPQPLASSPGTDHARLIRLDGTLLAAAGVNPAGSATGQRQLWIGSAGGRDWRSNPDPLGFIVQWLVEDGSVALAVGAEGEAAWLDGSGHATPAAMAGLPAPLAFVGGLPGLLLAVAGSPRQIWLSSDRGDSWSAAQHGALGTADTPVALLGGADGALRLAFRSGAVWISNDDGQSFAAESIAIPAGPDGAVTAALMVADALLAGGTAPLAQGGAACLWRRATGAGLWTRLPLPGGATLTHLASLGPGGPLFALTLGPAEAKLWRSEDQGQSWAVFGPALSGVQTLGLTALPGTTLAQLIEDVAVAAGLPAATIDAAACAAIAVEGWAVTGAMSAREALQPLLDAYAIEVTAQAGTLRFRPQTREIAAMLTADELLQDPERDAPLAYLGQRREGDPRERPARLALDWIDRARSFDSSTCEVAFAPEGPTQRLALPLILRPARARQLAEGLLRRLRAAATRLTLRLPPARLGLEIGDVVTLAGEAWRIARLTYDGALTVEAVPAALAAPPDPDAGEPPAPLTTPTGGPVPTRLAAFDLPPMDLPGEPAEGRAGLLLAAAPARGGPWRGVQLWPEGATHPRLALGVAAQIGTLAAPLAPAATCLTFDHSAALLLRLPAGATLASQPEAALLGRAVNLLAIGSELLQFADAAPAGTGLWRLTGLLRGRRGTESEAAEGHAADASVLVLDAHEGAGGWAFLDAPAEEAGQPLALRAAAPGQSPQSAPRFDLIQGARRLRLPAPTHVTIRAEPDGALALAWLPRLYRSFDLAATDPPPPPGTGWRIEVLDAGGAALRTETATLPAWLYPAAAQTGDAGSRARPLTLRLAARDAGGRLGLPATCRFPGILA